MKLKTKILSGWIILMMITIFSTTIWANSLAYDSDFTSIYVDYKPISIPNLYLYQNEFYMPLTDIAVLLKDSYSRFEVSWNSTKARTEILKHTPTANLFLKKLPSQIKPYPAGAHLYIGESSTYIKGFLSDGIFFAKLTDMATLIGFNIGFAPYGSCYIDSEPAPGVTELPLLDEYSYKVKTAVTGLPFKTVKQTFASSPVDGEFLYQTESGYVSVTVIDPFGPYIHESSQEAGSVKKVIIQNFNTNWQLINTKNLPFEGEDFGNFYHGEKYNYLIFYDSFPSRIKIVKYDSSFQRLSEVTLKETYWTKTKVDVWWGSSIAEFGDLLVIPAWIRSTINPHLDNPLTIVIDTKKMEVVCYLGSSQFDDIDFITENPFSYFDKIGNIFVVTNNARYPMRLQVSKLPQKILRSQSWEEYIGSSENIKQLRLFDIPGPRANISGIEMGNIANTESSLIVGSRRIDLAKVFTLDAEESHFLDKEGNEIGSESNIFIDIVDRSSLQYITKQLTDGDYKTVDYSDPKIVALSNNRFMILWNKVSKDDNGDKKICEYMVMDTNGRIISPIQPLLGYKLLGSEPIYANGKVMWTATIGSSASVNDGYWHIPNHRRVYSIDVLPEWLN